MQPKIYQFTEHQIAPQKIDPQAYYVIQKLRQAGFTAYLVGGGVRDLLLNQTPKDFDISTSARPEQIKALFRNAILIGRRFRLAHIRFGKKVIEVATFRSGATEDADLIVRDNVWGTEEQDVLRRDFTINGLFYDPENQVVIDYVDGYTDLQKRILRTIGQPEVRFLQDPVRMIRLIKFCARFNFDIEAPTFEALLQCKGEIVKSSSVRIFEELLRMLESGASRPFFQLLNEYGLLQSLSPVLSKYLEKANHMTLSLLGVVDDEIKKNGPLDRTLLLSTLIFPFFDDQLNQIAERMHLGKITDFAFQTIDQVFLPFFQIPRRMKGVMSLILTSQFRFNAPSRRPRIPNDPYFPFALNLLKLRSLVQPEFLQSYTTWTEALYSFHKTHGEKMERPRRRRRPRRKIKDRPVMP